MLLELKNELAAMQAKLELQQQEVSLCIVYRVLFPWARNFAHSTPAVASVG